MEIAEGAWLDHARDCLLDETLVATTGAHKARPYPGPGFLEKMILLPAQQVFGPLVGDERTAL
ncbi:MAG: hypothetical protein SynsKO_09280 [Synoicihabitans sp.]